MLELVRNVRSLLQNNPMAVGDILQKFLLESVRLQTMSPSMVWKLLHFRPRDKVSCTKMQGCEEHGKEPQGTREDGTKVGKERV